MRFAGNAAAPSTFHVTGTLSKCGGPFRIDHALDPANKPLYHSFVESLDCSTSYGGLATLDAKGETTVTLPDWFEQVEGRSGAEQVGRRSAISYPHYGCIVAVAALATAGSGGLQPGAAGQCGCLCLVPVPQKQDVLNGSAWWLRAVGRARNGKP